MVNVYEVSVETFLFWAFQPLQFSYGRFPPELVDFKPKIPQERCLGCIILKDNQMMKRIVMRLVGVL